VNQKNPDVIYAYGELQDKPGFVLIIGVTEETFTRTLREKRTVLVTPNVALGPIHQVVIFYEPTKDALRATYQEMSAKLNIPLRNWNPNAH
jgi:hypothetical protein